MDRLLVFLFSITLLMATSPPRAINEACDYSNGICTAKTGCSGDAESSCSKKSDKKNDCGKKSGCPLPICCFCGPCCCLCIVPERPVLHIAPPMPEEERVKPNGNQDFLPQQVSLAIWKPPAFSV